MAAPDSELGPAADLALSEVIPSANLGLGLSIGHTMPILSLNRAVVKSRVCVDRQIITRLNAVYTKLLDLTTLMIPGTL